MSTTSTEQGLRSLETGIRELLDKQEIAECITRLARATDRHDVELGSNSYHEDARDDHAIYIGLGRDLMEWNNSYHDATLSAHQHQISNMLIELDGDEAHAETYVTLVAVGKDTSVLSMGGGRYLDRLERRDSRWAITDRVLTIEWWNDPETLKALGQLSHPVSQDRSDLSYARPIRTLRADRTGTAPLIV
jgi:hypothetical protein